MRSTNPATRLIALSLLTAVAALSAASAARAAEPLRWKFNVGQKLDCAIVQDMNMAMTSGSAGQMNTTMHQQMDMQWEVKEVKSDGNAIIGQTISRVRMKMSAPRRPGLRVRFRCRGTRHRHGRHDRADVRSDDAGPS